MIRIPEPETHRAFSRLTVDEKNLIIAQRHVAYARDNGTLGNCLNELILLGLWDEAAKIDADLARDLQAAIEKDDGERCGCAHGYEEHKVKADGEVVWTGKAVAAKNYQTAYKVWSEKHDGIVSVYRCCLCDHLNAFRGDPDETHTRINEQRKASDKATAGQMKRWQVR